MRYGETYYVCDRSWLLRPHKHGKYYINTRNVVLHYAENIQPCRVSLPNLLCINIGAQGRHIKILHANMRWNASYKKYNNIRMTFSLSYYYTLHIHYVQYRQQNYSPFKLSNEYTYFVCGHFPMTLVLSVKVISRVATLFKQKAHTTWHGIYHVYA